jgi:hypothetical protein
VVVVDDGSPSPIPAAWVTARVPPTTGVALLRLDPNAGPAAARNAGLAAAADRGASLVAFMDADVSPRPGWLAAHVAAQAAPGRRGLVAGLTLAARGRGWPAAVVSRWHDETGTLNGRLLEGQQQQQQQPRREGGGGVGSAGTGGGMESSGGGSGWAPGTGGEGGRHAGRLPVPVPTGAGAQATTTTTTFPPVAAGDAGDGRHDSRHDGRRRPRRLSRHHDHTAHAPRPPLAAHAPSSSSSPPPPPPPPHAPQDTTTTKDDDGSGSSSSAALNRDDDGDETMQLGYCFSLVFKKKRDGGGECSPSIHFLFFFGWRANTNDTAGSTHARTHTRHHHHHRPPTPPSPLSPSTPHTHTHTACSTPARATCPSR